MAVALASTPSVDHVANGRVVATVFVYDPTDPGRNGVEVEADAVPQAVADALKAGRPVAVVPCESLVSFAAAGDFLNQPYREVVEAVRDGALTPVGPHARHLRFAALLAYRGRVRAERRQALDRLRATERELGLTD